MEVSDIADSRNLLCPKRDRAPKAKSTTPIAFDPVYHLKIYVEHKRDGGKIPDDKFFNQFVSLTKKTSLVTQQPLKNTKQLVEWRAIYP